jgi:hypothetical protein
VSMTDEKRSLGIESVTDLNRRQFFVRLGLGSLGIAAAGTTVFAYQFLSPNVLYEPSPIINAGKPESFPMDRSHSMSIPAFTSFIRKKASFR